MLRKNCKKIGFLKTQRGGGVTILWNFFHKIDFLKDGFPKWGPFFRIFRSIFPTFWSILLIFVYFSRFSEYFSECWAFFRICEVFFRISGIFPDFQLVHKYFFDFSGVFFQLFFYLGLASIFPTFQSIFSTSRSIFPTLWYFPKKKPNGKFSVRLAERVDHHPPPLKQILVSNFFWPQRNHSLDACSINRCV